MPVTPERRLALDFDHGLDIDSNPGNLAFGADAHLDLAQRRFERNRSVTTCDGVGATSDEAASMDSDALVHFGFLIAATDDDKQRSL
jgi:hypothetical protein